MYCFTYVNGLYCVFNELMLWSEISSEHPVFVKTVGELTNKNLPQTVVNQLMSFNKAFKDLKARTEVLQQEISTNPYSAPMYMGKVKYLINEFLVLDDKVLKFYPVVKQYGKEDKVWQTLLEHITEEQSFMYELFCNLNNQII